MHGGVRVATDVGGTYTDLVYVSSGRVGYVKVDTTPPDFERGVVAAVRGAPFDPRAVDFLVHGSTVVINALTERKGALTALLTTRGFRDVLEIGRGNTPDLFNIRYRKPRPFVPRRLRREVSERMSHRGAILTPLSEAELVAVLEELANIGVEAVGICFLHAYANPAHEQRAAALARAALPHAAVIASHEVTREWREYERTNTTLMAAYVAPRVRGYLKRLRAGLATSGIDVAPFIMQSNGGIGTIASASANPIAMVESGPVGGILGAVAYGRLLGESELIALDIGGTTAKCSLVRGGRPRITTDYHIERDARSAGYPLRVPVVDLVEIGSGGGSVAWLDSAGSLHVGPRSAGSQPGPVAYGRGGSEPTTTDANLLAGRIGASRFGGGLLTPDLDRVERAFAALGARLGCSGAEVARGVVRIANANMVNALKLVSVNRGHDPRDFALIAFGGGGPLHAAALAIELGIPRVIVPPHAAVFSAWGMLMIDLRRDLVRTELTPLDDTGTTRLAATFRSLEAEALDAFRAEAIGGADVYFERHVDARYAGQEHTVKIAIDGAMLADGCAQRLAERFHDEHQREYTFRLDAAVEIVNIHLIAYAVVEKPRIEEIPAGGPDPQRACTGMRDVDIDGTGPAPAALYDRALLLRGMRGRGPAIVEEAATATVVPRGAEFEVDRFGGLHVHLIRRSAGVDRAD